LRTASRASTSGCCSCAGWEFRAAQLANVTLSVIPVVILTAANTLTDGVHTLSDVEIMEKLFALDALLALVARYAAAARPSLTDH
jgi:hypothetical protein